jgi:hypothetical protein
VADRENARMPVRVSEAIVKPNNSHSSRNYIGSSVRYKQYY